MAISGITPSKKLMMPRLGRDILMKGSQSKSVLLVLLFVMSFVYLSCYHQQIKGLGKLATRQLELNNLRKISINGVGELFITQSQEENLLIKADDNILPYIISEIKNDELLLTIDKNVNIISKTPLVFNVNLKDISEIKAFGSSNIEIKSLKTNHLRINLNGSTAMNAEITVHELDITTSGSCAVILRGAASNQTLVLNGSTTLDGTNLMGKIATLNASGSSLVTLNVSEKISGSISGAGEVKYYNNPTQELMTSGVSTIEKL